MTKNGENGYSIIIITGVIALILLAMTVGLNAVSYIQRKNSVKIIARSIAEYGGTFLPNPQMAIDKSLEYWKLAKLQLGNAPIGIEDEDTAISFYFTSASGDKISADTNNQFALNGIQGALPITSMTVEVSDAFRFSFLNLGPTTEIFNVTSQSTVQLLPTDIAIVIENSNSLISKTEEELNSITAITGDFGVTQSGSLEWKDIYYPRNSCKHCPDPAFITCPPSCVTKDVHYTRQCFGKSAIDLKRAAITLYDLLSSSGTYRVSVIYNSSMSGEQAHVAVPLTSHPYCRAENDNECNFNTSTNKNFLPEHSLSVVPSEYSQQDILYPALEDITGPFDYHATRCARLTNVDGYKIPSHPLNELFENSYGQNFMEDLTPLMPPISSTNDPSHLRFIYNDPTNPPRLLPREVIWMKNFGYVYDSGIGVPNKTYNQLQFGLFRAIEHLYNSPEREDKLEVRRKVILVLTDGHEPGTVTDVFNEVMKAQDEITQNKITILNLLPHNPNPPPMEMNLKSDDFLAPLCHGSPTVNTTQIDRLSPYLLFNSTSVPPELYTSTGSNGSGSSNTIPIGLGTKAPHLITEGYKLGVLYYGFSDTNRVGLPRLSLHSAIGSDKETARNACVQGTRWSTARGRFWGEASPAMASTGLVDERYDLKSPDGYWALLAPMVARSLFVPEVVD